VDYRCRTPVLLCYAVRVLLVSEQVLAARFKLDRRDLLIATPRFGAAQSCLGLPRIMSGAVTEIKLKN
jgi:hypothetical protein